MCFNIFINITFFSISRGSPSGRSFSPNSHGSGICTSTFCRILLHAACIFRRESSRWYRRKRKNVSRATERLFAFARYTYRYIWNSVAGRFIARQGPRYIAVNLNFKFPPKACLPRARCGCESQLYTRSFTLYTSASCRARRTVSSRSFHDFLRAGTSVGHLSPLRRTTRAGRDVIAGSDVCNIDSGAWLRGMRHVRVYAGVDAIVDEPIRLRMKRVVATGERALGRWSRGALDRGYLGVAAPATTTTTTSTSTTTMTTPTSTRATTVRPSVQRGCNRSEAHASRWFLPSRLAPD